MYCSYCSTNGKRNSSRIRSRSNSATTELRDAVVEAIGVGDQPERDDLLGHAEVVEHLQRGRMQRGRALVLDRRRLLLEHGDGNAAPVERQRAHHADRPCSDDDDARVCLRSCHAGLVRVLPISSPRRCRHARRASFPYRRRWSWPSPPACCRTARRPTLRSLSRELRSLARAATSASRKRIDDLLRRVLGRENAVVGRDRRASAASPRWSARRADGASAPCC